MSSSSTVHRERDRYPSAADVRAHYPSAADKEAADRMSHARKVFADKIDPKLRDLRNYNIDRRGRPSISFKIAGVFSDAFLQALRTIVHQEFIDKKSGWRITHFKSHASPHGGYDDMVQDFTQITVEEDPDTTTFREFFANSVMK